jgi:hypothetical protein
MLSGPLAESCLERVRDLAEHGRRGDALSTAADEEVDHPAPALQSGHIRVEIQPIKAAHFQADVVFDNVGDIGHDSSSGWHQKRYHPMHVRDEHFGRLGRAPRSCPSSTHFANEAAPQTDVPPGPTGAINLVRFLVGLRRSFVSRLDRLKSMFLSQVFGRSRRPARAERGQSRHSAAARSGAALARSCFRHASPREPKARPGPAEAGHYVHMVLGRRRRLARSDQAARR